MNPKNYSPVWLPPTTFSLETGRTDSGSSASKSKCYNFLRHLPTYLQLRWPLRGKNLDDLCMLILYTCLT